MKEDNLYYLSLVSNGYTDNSEQWDFCRPKPCTDVASNLLAIDLRLNVRIAFDDLQQKFQHAEYFTCDPLISQAILI